MAERGSALREALMLSGPGSRLDAFDRLYRALDQAARIAEVSRRMIGHSVRSVDASRRAIARAEARQTRHGRALEAAPARPVTLTCPSRVVAVGALISVAVEMDGCTAPLLFLPDDFRRLGAEPRPSDRWALSLGVDLDGGTILGVRLVALAAL